MQRQTIGRYQIREELGRGAMGVVFRAVDSVIGRTVAIKTIRLEAFTDPAERARLRDRLLREARSAGLLSHRNIVTVYDVGEEHDIAFIAMEYVAGRTVEQTLRENGRLECEQVIGIITQVAAALDYAHSQGVVHRDIKPGNLMMAADTSVRIMDFGVAKLLSHQATQSDLMLGTPNYMAPEQIDARGVDGRTDQFALAVIAYELLTGERPFRAEVLSALFLGILREDPPPPHLLNSTLNERVSAVISRALEKAPADRFATCSAFAKALSQSLAGCRDWKPLGRAASGTMATVAAASPIVAPPVEPPAFTRVGPPPKSSAGWIVGTLFGLAAIAGLAGAGYLFYPRPAVSRSAPARPAPTPPPVSAESRPSPLAEPVAPPPTAPAAAETVSKVTPPKPNPPAGPVSGVVDIESRPAGAMVRFDNTLDECKTPCSMELSQGRHVLHFKLDGYRNGTLIMTVPQETSGSVRLDPQRGTLLVHTTPPGAQILVNGQLQKEQSPATLRMAPGKYKLTLRREGRDQSRDIELRDEAITQVDVTWP
jgi:serine/threonine-protein kinase